MKDTFATLAEKAASGRSSPSLGILRRFASQFVEELLGVLFPHYNEGPVHSAALAETNLRAQHTKLASVVQYLEQCGGPEAKDVCAHFFEQLSSIYDVLILDAEAIHRGDPASKSVDEVILCYPGFFAITSHRIAHALNALKVPLLPRVLSEYAHSRTGIDIHPGATIGKHFCIDHGTGIVIGETTIINDNVSMYQGVTLGGLAVSKNQQSQKRHPTIEDNVTIYANATVLGGNTTIGAGSIIGGSVWITISVPPHSVVYHKGDFTFRKSDSVHL